MNSSARSNRPKEGKPTKKKRKTKTEATAPYFVSEEKIQCKTKRRIIEQCGRNGEREQPSEDGAPCDSPQRSEKREKLLIWVSSKKKERGTGSALPERETHQRAVFGKK